MKAISKSFFNISALLVAGVLVLSSCGKEERERLQAEAQLLEQKLQERDSAFNSIMTVMAEVEGQIDEIKEQGGIISANSADFEEADETTMVDDLRRINDLIVSTNEKLQGLSSKLNNSSIELNAFKKRLQKMAEDLKTQEQTVASLREELATKNEEIAVLNTEVKSLATQVELQEETIVQQNDDLAKKVANLNTAYFAIDKEKSLLDNGLISKEGGFLWIGRATELQSDAALEKFTKIDVKSTQRFYIDGKKIELVTEHPTESYKLVTEGDIVKYLEVTNPAEFWRISKFLVISIKS